MKFLRFFSILTAVLIADFGFSLAETPRQYNDRLIDIQNRVIVDVLDFSKALNELDYNNLEQSFRILDSKYSILVKNTDKAVKQVKKEKSFKKDDKFRKSLEDLIVFYQSIFRTEYKEMISILKKGNSMTDGDINRLKEIQLSVQDREAVLNEKLQVTQREFASKNGLQLKENEYQDDIDNLNKNSNKTLSTDSPKNYNDKLISYQEKVAKTFIDMIQLISSGDKSQIDVAYANALRASAEAVEEIKIVGPYEGNDLFRQKLQVLLEFYKSIIENEYKEMLKILELGSEIKQTDLDRLKEIQDSITRREAILDKEMSNAQKAFSEKYGIQLKENQYQNDLDKYNE